MKLNKHIVVKGTFRAITGLRIGAGNASIEIGGLDNPIMRNPLTKVPYVPGSSLKGKLRSLLEVSGYTDAAHSTAPTVGEGPCTCNQCVACWLFGCGDATKATSPTRLIFRDCPMSESEVVRQESLLDEGIFYSEVKDEIAMNRKTGVTKRGSLRPSDRIIAGSALDFSLTIRVIDNDDEGQMQAALAKALTLLEAEGLGGSVSRGYGQVKFEDLTWDGKPWDIHAKSGTTA